MKAHRFCHSFFSFLAIGLCYIFTIQTTIAWFTLEYSKVPSFACFRRLFWRTPSTLKFLNQVRPMIYTVFRYDIPQCTSHGTLQVIVKSNWQHTSLDETMISSYPEFYANASLSSQVLCRKHNIYMYLGEYSTKLWLFVK